MKTHTTPAGPPADITTKAADQATRGASEVVERAEGALRDLESQFAEQSQVAEEAQAILDGLAQEEAAEHDVAAHLEDEAARLQAARSDAALRLGLMNGHPDEASAQLRVAQFDDQLRDLDARSRAQRAEAASQAAAREQAATTARERLLRAQESCADLQSQRGHLERLAHEAHEQLGQALADALEANALAARREVVDLRLRLSIATLREQELADGVIEQLVAGGLRQWPAQAQRLEATWARDPEMPASDDPREPALRAFLDLADALADDSVTDLYHDSPFSPPTRFANTVSLHPDVLADVLRHHGIERRHRLDMVRQQASTMLGGLESDRQHATARARASRRARILGQE